MAQPTSSTRPGPFTPAWHVRAELMRVLEGLARCLRAQRDRGRTAAGDAVRGFVIEEGETEGLVAELAAHLRGEAHEVRAAEAEPSRVRDAIAARADRSAGQGTFLPLRHVQRAFALTAAEYDAVLLALAVELDGRFGRIVAYLNDHAGRTRPTLGLALAVTHVEGTDPISPVSLLDRPLVRDGLVELEGDVPLPGQTLRLARGMIARLSGVPGDDTPPWLTVRTPQPDLLERLVLDDLVAHQLAGWGEDLRARRQPLPLLVAGQPGNGRATAACAALFRAGLPVVQVDVVPEALAERLRVARREARWHDAAMLLRVTATTASPLEWPVLWRGTHETRALAIVLAPDQVTEASDGAPAEPAVIRVEEPGVSERARLWATLLPRGVTFADSELAELAGRFPFGPGRIERAIRRAAADVSLRTPGERRLNFGALIGAARVVDAAAIGPLAQKLALPYVRADLIVPPHVASELDLALAWVRHRHRVLHEWGFVGRVTMGHGLTALFSGPSGTGKTMAAQVLARELGLDLFRIDLSQIMSKYIGETEKNLAQVFGARVGVLFFDEAEVILGRRHETKDARDRYANIEIAYLLQRMEEYDGVTILATNRPQDIDEAFIRRLHVVIDFPMPTESDRARIWEGMLPASAARTEDLDLRALAREFDISGGQIKNAALAGAYLAAAARQPISMDHLRRAANRELVKSGKVIENE